MTKFDWKVYTGNLDWLPTRTIFLTKHGSHAYGTNTPESDLDLKGVAVPPAEYFHGYLHKFEQAESKSNGNPEKPDFVVYDIRKFFFLAANCNPNIIEVLFTDPEDHLQVDPTWRLIQEHRNLFLSKRVKFSFSGYAHAQLKRIETHRRWLLHPPDHKPTRLEFDLPETHVIPKEQLDAAMAAIRKKVESANLDLEFLPDTERQGMLYMIAGFLEDMRLGADDQFKAAGRVLGYEDNFLIILEHERAYKNALAEWNHYQNWVATRNPIRAELEKKYGYDTKHGAHLVRLIRMAEEILTTGKVIVKRPDAQELLDIRKKGAWSYDRLIEWAKLKDQWLEHIYKYQDCPIPKKPDANALDKLCQDAVEEWL